MKKLTIAKWIACFLGMVLVLLVTFFEVASFTDFSDEMSKTEKVFGIVMVIICIPAVAWLWGKTDKYEEEGKQAATK